MPRTIQTTETFIKKANKVHNNFYDYTDTIYTHNRENINIICPKHGSFSQRPDTHLAGKGCKTCGLERRKDCRRSTTEAFIQKAIKKHGDAYKYTFVNYIDSKTKVDIECPIHGIFQQKPNSHLNGDGCKACSLEDITNSFSTSGFIKASKGKKCTLYILKCFNNLENFYKIGITTRTVKQRYDSQRAMPYSYEIMKEIYGDAEDIWNLEVKLKQQLTSKYTPQIPFDGSARECFADYEEILQALY